MRGVEAPASQGNNLIFPRQKPENLSLPEPIQRRALYFYAELVVCSEQTAIRGLFRKEATGFSLESSFSAVRLV
jgi:hypothetical protein